LATGNYPLLINTKVILHGPSTMMMVNSAKFLVFQNALLKEETTIDPGRKVTYDKGTKIKFLTNGYIQFLQDTEAKSTLAYKSST